MPSGTIYEYTVNDQNLSFFIIFFHHEAHEEYKKIIKIINSNLRAPSCPSWFNFSL